MRGRCTFLRGWVAVVSIAVVSSAAVGCDEGGGEEAPAQGDASDAAADVAVAADRGPAADAATLEDRLRGFCTGYGIAKCQAAVECLGRPPPELGLSGGGVDACAAAEAEDCTADVLDRLARGTLNEMALNGSAIEDCVNWVLEKSLEGARCNPATLVDWASNWRKTVADKCEPVIGGTVGESAACVRRTDCQQRDHICDGVCRFATASDIQQTCRSGGLRPGHPTPSDECPGGICVQVPMNDVGIEGRCSIDCENGLGCPGGEACLSADLGDGRWVWYCAKICNIDADCQGDLSCQPINALQPDGAKHCTTPPRVLPDAGM